MLHEDVSWGQWAAVSTPAVPHCTAGAQLVFTSVLKCSSFPFSHIKPPQVISSDIKGIHQVWETSSLTLPE